jgi:hypothetical protein
VGNGDNERADDSPSFARGISSSIGKCVDDIKVWLPVDIAAELKQLAASDGATASEFLRDMVMLKLRGRTWGELQAESRRAAILGTGSVTALRVAGEVKAS